MKETILLYNFTSPKVRNAIKSIAIQMGVHIRTVEPEQYQMPLGLLSFGSQEDQKDYLVADCQPFEDSMLIFAGLTNQRLNQFLKLMSKNKVPRIALKATLTEHNAVWNSVALHDELVKEHEFMTGENGRKES